MVASSRVEVSMLKGKGNAGPADQAVGGKIAALFEKAGFAGQSLTAVTDLRDHSHARFAEGVVPRTTKSGRIVFDVKINDNHGHPIAFQCLVNVSNLRVSPARVLRQLQHATSTKVSERSESSVVASATA